MKILQLIYNFLIEQDRLLLGAGLVSVSEIVSDCQQTDKHRSSVDY